MNLKRFLGLDIRSGKYSYVNDPVVGYTASERSADRWVATTCGYCSVGCGMQIGVRAGRAVSVRGNPDHPVNLGLFGLMSIFARTLGGYLGDKAGIRWGLRGRVSSLGIVLLLEGLSLILFSQLKTCRFRLPPYCCLVCS